MLRIKEGVNLETLKDYGFVESKNTLVWKNTNVWSTGIIGTTIIIDKQEKTVETGLWGKESNGMVATIAAEKALEPATELLFELMAQKIIEKMEDENE